MINYSDFERKFTVRKYGQLINPTLFRLRRFQLPRGSIMHYLPKDSVELGIEPRDAMLNGTRHRDDESENVDVLVHHVEELTTKLGNPKDSKSVLRPAIKEYHKRYRRMRLGRKLTSSLRDERTLVVLNYALCQHRYLYRRTALSNYHGWLNIQNTLWSEIQRMAEATDRQQFIEIGLPEVLPSHTEFHEAAKRGFSRATLSVFKDAAHLSLLELFLWLAPDAKADTAIDELPATALKKLNLVFMESGQFTVLPLSNLLEWRDEDPTLIPRKFYDFLERLFELRTAHKVDETETVVEESVAVVNPDTKARTKKAMELITEAAEQGLISAAEYRRIEKLSTKYTTLKNPVGEGTLQDLLTIDMKSVNSLEESRSKDTPAVSDKSMLKTTLKEFDRRYINELLDKDLANVVMAVQNLGISVVDYKKENVKDALNDYDIYTLRVVPVHGKPSTIRFRLPRIRPDGTYIANGTKARFSKQRGD